MSDRPGLYRLRCRLLCRGEQIRHRSNSKHEREGGYPNHPNSLRWCGKSVYAAPLDYLRDRMSWRLFCCRILVLMSLSLCNHVYAQPGLVLGSFQFTGQCGGRRAEVQYVLGQPTQVVPAVCKVERCLGCHSGRSTFL